MVKSDIKLGIIIPAFNCRETIAETLASLQAIECGWDHVAEVVVCDDASTDDTIVVIKTVDFDRCPLKLLRHETNLGEGRSYTTMVASLPSDVNWFIILHADDLAETNLLERNIDIARRCCPRVATVSSNFWVFGKSLKQPILSHDPPQEVIIWRGGKHDEIMHTAMIGTWWHISGALVNRPAWEKFGGFEPAFTQLADWDLMLRWQHNGYVIGHSLIPTTKYRISAGSLSSQSYLKFRDIHDRTLIMIRHPALFTRKLRIAAAGKIAFQSLRRILKLIITGKLGYAVRGAALSASCVFMLAFAHPRHAS